jgi:hypothetical protein
VRHALEREREGRDPTTVDGRRNLDGRHLRKGRHLLQQQLLERMRGQTVALGRPAARAAERQKASVLA